MEANVASKIAAGGFAFCVHRVFTFGTVRPESLLWSSTKYAILLGVNNQVTSALLVLLEGWLLLVAATVTAAPVGVAINFLISRRFVFPVCRPADGPV